MAENIPNLPPGAVPPKPEGAGAQPKKETVRITLPPKPTAAPTIKLPTLPQSAPAGGAAPATPAAPSVPPKPAVPSAPQVSAPPSTPPPGTTPPPGGTTGAKLATTPGPKGTPPPTAAKEEPAKGQAPKPAPALAGAATVSVIDKVLAILAMVSSLAAVGCIVYLLSLLQQALGGGGGQ